MKLSNVKPYLLARLTAPSTPKEARSEVVAQIRQAEAEQKTLPTTKAVRATVARHNPKPSEATAKLARSRSPTSQIETLPILNGYIRFSSITGLLSIKTWHIRIS